MSDNVVEIQRLALFSTGVGTLLYSTKQNGLYKPGLVIIIISLIINMYIENIPYTTNNTPTNMIPKNMAIIIYLIIIFIIYYLYYKYEDIIHENNIYGDFKRFSNQITIIFMVVFFMEIFFMLYLLKSNNNDYILIYSIIIYCLTLILSIITTNIYIRLKII
jgi:hypothetical protein